MHEEKLSQGYLKKSKTFFYRFAESTVSTFLHTQSDKYAYIYAHPQLYDIIELSLEFNTRKAVTVKYSWKIIWLKD
jgi:hypothetical protein